MDVLGIGAGPLFIFLILGLLLFGPTKVVQNARTAGKYIRSFKRMSSEFTEALTREADLGGEIKSAGTDLSKPFQSLTDPISTDTVAAGKSVKAAHGPFVSRLALDEGIESSSGEPRL